jgi:hypothetical protein
VTHSGFRPFLGTGIGVEANRVTTFDPRLEVGAAETRIEVSGESSEILNPDTGSCVGPGDVHWVEGTGFPNAATVGRNTLRTGATNSFDLNLSKSVPLGEKRRLELRWEALNALNHPQFVQVPQTIVNGTPAGRFLNRDFTDSGIRSMWVQVKLNF